MTLLKKDKYERKKKDRALRGVKREVMLEPSRYEKNPSLYDVDFSRTSASDAMLKNMANTISANGDYVAMPGEFPITNKDGSINIQETLKDVGYDSTTQSLEMKRYQRDPFSDNRFSVDKQILDSGNRQALRSLLFNRAQLAQQSSTYAGSDKLAKKAAEKIKSPADVDKFMNAEAKKIKKLYDELFVENQKYVNEAIKANTTGANSLFLNNQGVRVSQILYKIGAAQYITQRITGFRAMATPNYEKSVFNAPDFQILMPQFKNVPTLVYPAK